jgi:hypothetical protein
MKLYMASLAVYPVSAALVLQETEDALMTAPAICGLQRFDLYILIHRRNTVSGSRLRSDVRNTAQQTEAQAQHTGIESWPFDNAAENTSFAALLRFSRHGNVRPATLNSSGISRLASEAF